MIEIESLEALDKRLSFSDVVFQSLDLNARKKALMRCDLSGAVMLGCDMDNELCAHALACGALVFPKLPGLPFDPYRNRLYGVDDLYDKVDYADCFDARVYEHWKATGRANPPSILETLARRLHDHAMTDALGELIAGRRVVAIMGGHKMPRGDGAYADVARIAKSLSERGYLMTSGGGPGAMEATHVGAWFSSRDESDMLEAIALLSEAPLYSDKGWLAVGRAVRRQFHRSDRGSDGAPASLGIPTWLYGHEPPNPFATHVAKYFANSVREDGLLTIATHGVVFSPGSAGTIQEIFQDACQNHYESVGFASPMVFLDSAYWTQQKPVYPLLKELAKGKGYDAWLSITDDPAEAVERIAAFQPA